MRKYFCCDERRRSAVLAHGSLNGIDFLEVSDNEIDPVELRQRTLRFHFLKALPAVPLATNNFRIDGGERIRNITVTAIQQGGVSSPPASPPSPPSALAANVVEVSVSRAGDFSTYTLRVAGGLETERPPSWVDPILSAVDFSFKVACPSEFDCAGDKVCPPTERSTPDINYLAKDYASFRQLMLDRIAVLAPDWMERSPADFGIMMVELLAYLGDRISYEQDARHTEAYLATARKRVSVRRLARLVDYFLHDGANSRAWVQIVVRDGTSGVMLRRESDQFRTKLLTAVPNTGTLIRNGSAEYHRALIARPTVFETLEDIELNAEHNEIHFYDWGDEECCLPQGATTATLSGELSTLRTGNVLIFGERRGPRTGQEGDADPSKRHAVRLTRVEAGEDPLGGRLVDPPTDLPSAITEVEWSTADALPFPLCISARSEQGLQRHVSVAWGNIVLADHGRTLDEPETLLRVPEPDPALTLVATTVDRCTTLEPIATPVRYRPVLSEGPVTQATAFDAANPPAAADSIKTDERAATPAIRLVDQDTNLRWDPVPDLLGSGGDAREFVVEVEADGRASLRFGDDIFGARPAAYTRFEATYRIGNGTDGNIGAESLAHLVSADSAVISEIGDDALIRRVWNPLPASGGKSPETVAQARQNAPEAFRTQERAVTEADYAEKALQVGGDVQRAAATFRWTGSWHTVFLTADRLGGRAVDATFENNLRASMERFRMAGHDLEVDAPRPVPLEIQLSVCLQPGYFASDVKEDLLELFSNRRLPDGQRGLFHPDNFTFGQPLYLSPLLAAAQNVAGVASVTVLVFRRQGQPLTSGLAEGRLDMGLLEIAQLENNPNFPERGVIRISVSEATV